MRGIPLLCLPPAGAGGSFFHPWTQSQTSLMVMPIELPGREKRLIDEPVDTMSALIDDLLPRLPGPGRDEPVLFGHSFGAVVAFELAAALITQGRHPTLVVSGSRKPGSGLPRPISGLPDEEFIAAVHEVAGFRHPAMDDPELLELILPALRADIHLHERYRPDAVALTTPILALRGNADELVSTDDCAAWAEFTTDRCEVRMFPGGHMYLVDEFPAVLRAIEDHVAVLGAGR